MYIKRSETLSQIFLIEISNETFMFDNSDCNKWSLFSDHLKDQNNFFLSDAKTKKCIFKKNNNNNSNNFLTIPIL